MGGSLAHVALAALTALSWLGLGTVLLRPAGPTGDRALDGLNRLGAGAVGFALLTAAAGLGGLARTSVYVPVFVVSAAAGAVAARRLASGARLPSFRSWPRWELALVGLVAVYVLVDVLATAAPISSQDALNYHAAAPAIFERTHSIGELSWSWATYQPFTVEMLMLDGNLLWDYVQGAYAPLLLALAALATVATAAERLAGRSVAVLAAAIFFAQPFMAWAATSTFVEPALAFVLALAAWNLARFIREGSIASLVLAGVFAGAGAGIKYVGVATAAALVLGGALAARKRLDRRAALAFGLPALLVALPWYAKNAIQTGDPFFPLLRGGPNAASEESRRQILEGYGAGRGPLDALLLPFRLLAKGDLFDRGDFVSPLYLMFAPLALLNRPARRTASVVLVASALYVGAWFLSSQQARYLLPLTAPLAVLAAVGILAVAARGPLGRLAAVTVTAAALVAGLGITAVYASQFAPVVAGRTSADAFLARKASYYEGARWLNDHLPADARVLYEGGTLYVDRDVQSWTLEALPKDAGRAETRRFFARLRPTHVAVASTSLQRVEQLRYVGARPLARVVVHQVYSRTRDELGPPETMLVFTVAGSAR